MNLHQTLSQYILDQCLKGQLPEGFDDDYNLIDAGFMDSLAIINTVSYLEENCGIAIDDGDIVPEHFMSVNALTAFVRQKSA
ncbi:MAG: phosphopantetheine-binding protein [Desulfobacterales bacterium]|nr:phosphopantetheine-binding protein [Desulfobacterales bacterium]